MLRTPLVSLALILAVFFASALDLTGFALGVQAYAHAIAGTLLMDQCIREDDAVLGLTVLEWVVFDTLSMAALLIAYLRALSVKRGSLVSHGAIVVAVLLSAIVSLLHYVRVSPCWVTASTANTADALGKTYVVRIGAHFGVVLAVMLYVSLTWSKHPLVGGYQPVETVAKEELKHL